MPLFGLMLRSAVGLLREIGTLCAGSPGEHSEQLLQQQEPRSVSTGDEPARPFRTQRCLTPEPERDDTSDADDAADQSGSQDEGPGGEVIAHSGQLLREADAAESGGFQAGQKRAVRSLDLQAISMDDWC